MNLFIILLGYVLKSREDLIDATKVYFLENMFWDEGQEIVKTDKGFLGKISISLGKDCLMEFDNEVHYYFNTCHFLKSTNQRYVKLEESMTNEIISYLKSSKSDKLFFRFCMNYAKHSFKDRLAYGKFLGEEHKYITYEVIEMVKDNKDKNLKYDGIEPHLFHIEELFSSLIDCRFSMDSIFFNEIKSKILLEGLKESVKFKLYYFENFEKCLKYLDVFFNDLSCFHVLNEDCLELESNERSCVNLDRKTTLTISEFINRLKLKNNENQKNLELEDFNNTCKLKKALFEKNCKHIKWIFENYQILFIMHYNYDIDYYITSICNIILKAVNLDFEKYKNLTLEDVESINKFDLEFFEYELLEVCKSFFLSFSISKRPQIHFSKTFGINVETLQDYDIIDKILCDYNNMSIYIVNNCDNILEYQKLLPHYNHPVFIDNFIYRIINGFEIIVRTPAKFSQIKAFDDKGREFNFEKDVHYFIDDVSGNLYCPSEVLKINNVKEIEVVSYVAFFIRFSKKYKVNDFLNQ